MVLVLAWSYILHNCFLYIYVVVVWRIKQINLIRRYAMYWRFAHWSFTNVNPKVEGNFHVKYLHAIFNTSSCYDIIESVYSPLSKALSNFVCFLNLSQFIIVASKKPLLQLNSLVKSQLKFSFCLKLTRKPSIELCRKVSKKHFKSWHIFFAFIFMCIVLNITDMISLQNWNSSAFYVHRIYI